MKITRRNMLAATAAAVTTSAIVTPLALKAAGVKAALAGDPVLPAYEAYEAARLQCSAMSDYRLAIVEAAESGIPPEPHRNRTYLELSYPEWEEGIAWREMRNRRVAARLGMDEDAFMDIHHDRVLLAYETVADIPAATFAGLLCQLRAWWSMYEGHTNTGVPKLDPEVIPWEPQSVVQRLYHDLERLAGEAPS